MRRWIAANCVIIGAASLVADGHWWAIPTAAALMALNGIVYLRKTNHR